MLTDCQFVDLNSLLAIIQWRALCLITGLNDSRKVYHLGEKWSQAFPLTVARHTNACQHRSIAWQIRYVRDYAKISIRDGWKCMLVVLLAHASRLSLFHVSPLFFLSLFLSLSRFGCRCRSCRFFCCCHSCIYVCGLCKQVVFIR